MLSWWWNSVAAQLSTLTLLIIGCLVAAWFFPPFRKWLIGAAGLLASIGVIYGKGAADQKRKQKEANDAAVKKVQDDYKQIDDRPASVDTTTDRMRRGDF